MRLLAGDRVGPAAAIAVLLVGGVLTLLLGACVDSEMARPTAVPAAEGSPTVEPPPSNVTIVPLTPDPSGEPRAEVTAEPARCPDPFPEGHPLHGTETLRLDQADEVPEAPRISLPLIVVDGGLERAIRDRLGEDEGRYAVIVKDVRDGRGVTINGDRLFYAASLFKLEVLFEAFHQREAGLVDFGEEYIVSDYYEKFGLGPRLTEQCEQVTIDRALAAMMSVSDNAAAVMLQDRLGPRHINASMQNLGLTSTGLFPDNGLPTTADDLALLLEAIARGEAVSEDASKAMVDLLVSEKIDDRIPSGLPDGTVVAHKTGNWENATHDAGIVYGARSTYVVVLLSDIGFDGDAAAVERDVMRIAWEWFEGAPE